MMIKQWLKKLMEEVPLDYQLGYQDGFNAGIKVMQDTLKHIGKLDIKNVQRVHPPQNNTQASPTEKSLNKDLTENQK